MRKKTIALPIFAVSLIGLAVTVVNPVLLVHALNPQPLPPGIVLHLPKPITYKHAITPVINTPGTILHFERKHAVTPPVNNVPGAILHFEPPDPCLHLALCKAATLQR